MQYNDQLAAEEDEEEITISLPSSALETLGMQLGGQISSGYSFAETTSSITAGAISRNAAFPCFKKHAWGDRLLVKITQEHAAPDAV